MTRRTNNQRTKPDPRYPIIYDLRLDGLSLERIGKKIGLTRERIRQILVEGGGDIPEDVLRQLQSRKATETRQRQQAEADAIIETIESAPPFTYHPDDIREWTSDPVVRSIVLNAVARLMPLGRGSQLKVAWTPERVLECLRAAWVCAQADGLETLSHGYYLAWHKTHREACSYVTVLKRFGLWSTACVEAGVPHGQPPNRTYHGFTREDCVRAIARMALEQPDSTVSIRQYELWAQHTKGVPSRARLVQVCGDWTPVRSEALALLGRAP